MIFMLVILTQVASQWSKGGGRQVSKASGFEEGGRQTGKWIETPPGGSPAMPGVLSQCRLQRSSFSLQLMGYREPGHMCVPEFSAAHRHLGAHMWKGNMLRTGSQERSDFSSDYNGPWVSRPHP